MVSSRFPSISSEYRAEKQTWRKAFSACLPLAHSLAGQFRLAPEFLREKYPQWRHHP
nr:uncharacterized protein LOC118879485 isoform X2 [Drosophila suzukii]